MSEQIEQVNVRVADLFKENQENVGKLQKTMETKPQLESELMAAKAVVVSHEKIFEKLAVLQVSPTKSVNTKKNSIDSQNFFLIQKSRQFSGGESHPALDKPYVWLDHGASAPFWVYKACKWSL